MKTFRSITLLSLMAAYGCAVGPNFNSPQLSLPEKFSQASASASFNSKIEWWQGFGDPKLTQLIHAGIENNHTLDQSLARLNEARANRGEVFLDLFPTIRANGGYSISRDSTARVPVGVPAVQQRREIYEAGGNATWELDFFGRVRREIERDAATEQARAAELDDAIRIVTAEIAQNYIELRGQQQQLIIAKENAANQRETVRVAQARFDRGEVSDFDLARTQSQYELTSARIPLIVESALKTIHRLGVLTGQNPEALLNDLNAVQNIPQYQGERSVDSPAELIKRRPDVRAAESELHAATAEKGVIIGDLFPRVTFNGSIGVQAPSPSGFNNRGADFYSFGPSISWAALDIGRVMLQVDASDARLQAALAKYQQAVLTALEDTENSLLRYSSEEQRYQSLEIAAKASERAAAMASTQYQEGAIDLLGLLDAANSKLEAQDARSQSEAARAVAIIGIFRSFAGGWQAISTTGGAAAGPPEI